MKISNTEKTDNIQDTCTHVKYVEKRPTSTETKNSQDNYSLRDICPRSMIVKHVERMLILTEINTPLEKPTWQDLTLKSNTNTRKQRYGRINVKSVENRTTSKETYISQQNYTQHEHFLRPTVYNDLTLRPNSIEDEQQDLTLKPNNILTLNHNDRNEEQPDLTFKPKTLNNEQPDLTLKPNNCLTLNDNTLNDEKTDLTLKPNMKTASESSKSNVVKINVRCVKSRQASKETKHAYEIYSCRFICARKNNVKHVDKVIFGQDHKCSKFKFCCLSSNCSFNPAKYNRKAWLVHRLELFCA